MTEYYWKMYASLSTCVRNAIRKTKKDTGAEKVIQL